MRIECPYRVLFISRHVRLNKVVKEFVEDKMSDYAVSVTSSTDLKFLKQNGYINYDIAFVDIASLTSSDFVKLNVLHHNWRFLRLILLLERVSSNHIYEFSKRLKKHKLSNNFEYLTIDRYSNEMVGRMCINYCQESLNLWK